MRALLILLVFINGVFSNPCSVCKNLVTEFYKGLQSSEKSNFGGGNTAWEEERLGQFATSETRLIHIIDSLCPTSIKDRDKCQYFREEVEEILEKWWFNQFRENTKRQDLDEFLCVNNSKLCCPNNHYGTECILCKHFDQGIERFCSGHGYCNGNGTRSGSGDCECDAGYLGDTCDACDDNFFKDDIGNCSKCNIACEKCNGPESTNCVDCADGFDGIDGDCIDVDECKNETCNNGKFCFNTPGSYECKNCDSACLNCTGDGPTKCHHCANGYQKINGVCEDINECSADSTFCRETGQKCVNLPGTFECNCQTGYEKQSDGSCKVKPVESKKDSSKKTNSKSSTNNKPNTKTKTKNKKIWTRKFEREFFKLICSILALAFISYFVGRYAIIVAMAGIAVGYFVYYKSIRLDEIFSKS